MAIRSKHNQRHVYEELEPIFDCRTGKYLHQVSAVRTDGYAVTLLVSDIFADTEEDQALLDSFEEMIGEKEEWL